MLLLSLIMLFAGPVLFVTLSREREVARVIDRVIVIVLVLLALLLLVPHTIESLGWLSFLYLAIGFGFPTLLESLARQAAHSLHKVTLLVALAGLVLHALVDGAGLAGSEYRAGEALAGAIALHRFGVGLMLWLIVQPVFGAPVAWSMLVAMALATIAGYAFSTPLLPVAGDDLMLAVQAVITGTILHGLIHRGHARVHPPGDEEKHRRGPGRD